MMDLAHLALLDIVEWVEDQGACSLGGEARDALILLVMAYAEEATRPPRSLPALPADDQQRLCADCYQRSGYATPMLWDPTDESWVCPHCRYELPLRNVRESIGVSISIARNRLTNRRPAAEVAAVLDGMCRFLDDVDDVLRPQRCLHGRTADQVCGQCTADELDGRP